MNTVAKVIAISSMLISSGMVSASEEALQLGTCLTDSLNGKERKNLAKWIFLGMSSHSLIEPFSNVSESDFDHSNKFVGELVTRLLIENCPEQAKAAAKVNGAAAFEQAFEIVGQVAMQELMTEPSVGQSLGAFEKYLDQEKINNVFN